MSTQTFDQTDDLDNDDDEQQQVQQSQQPSRQLREAAKRAEKTSAENADLKQKLAVYEAGLGNLTPKQVKAVLAAHEGDLTADGLKATAVELAFIEAPDDTAEQQQIESDIAGQSRISHAASGAGRGSATAQLTGPEVAGWPVDRQMRLLEQHPDVYDRLMRGETVSGVAFV